MFDYVRCRCMLPHHQDAEFQTEDIARIVDPADPMDGLLDRYVITKTGRLRRQLHKRKTGAVSRKVVMEGRAEPLSHSIYLGRKLAENRDSSKTNGLAGLM